MTYTPTIRARTLPSQDMLAIRRNDLNPLYRGMDERELLDRLRRGDEAAYDAIFRQWYGPLVATTAALIERTNAERTCGSFHATEYQCAVQC